MKMQVGISSFDLKRGRNQLMEEEEEPLMVSSKKECFVCLMHCILRWRSRSLWCVWDPDMAGLGWKPDGWRKGGSGAPHGVNVMTVPLLHMC